MNDKRPMFVSGTAWIFAGLAAAGLVFTAGSSADPPPAHKTVRMVIDYADGVEKHFTTLAWREGATVFDVMEAAGKHPRGIRVQYRDYGGSAGRLVTGIDGLANQGGGQDARNWLYQVNEVRAKRACDKQTVEAGDTVVWKFDLQKP
ncbi:MAG: DUF4430 domain-containing protein [Phycisphaerae bacterium]